MHVLSYLSAINDNNDNDYYYNYNNNKFHYHVQQQQQQQQSVAVAGVARQTSAVAFDDLSPGAGIPHINISDTGVQVSSLSANMADITNVTDLVNITNFTSPFKSAVSLNYNLPTMIAVAAILFVVTIATAFGNFLVGLALFKFRNLRTISNHLIGNLALSDFLLATTILPFSTVQECLGYWVFGEIMCNAWLCVDVLYCTASIWNLCIIGLDRYTATLYPLWYREKRSNSQAAIYIAIVWLTAFAVSVPPLLGWNDLSQNYVYNNRTNVYTCTLFQNRSYVLFSASGSFFIPFLITVIFYIRIFMVLRVRMLSMRRNKKEKQRKLNAISAGNKPVQSAVVLNEKPGKGGKSSSTEVNNLTLPDSTAEIELSQVGLSVGDGPSGMEDSSKSVFSTDSGDDDDDDDDSCTQLRTGCNKPLCATNAGSDGVGYTTRVIKNGLKEKGTKSETLVILNPAHDHLYSSDDKDSDNEHVQIAGGGKHGGDENASNKKLLKNKKNKNKGGKGGGHGAKSNGESKRNKRPVGIKLRAANPFKSRSTTNTETSLTAAANARAKKVDQREVRATIRMAIIIAVFCTCWFGFFTTYVLHSWCEKCDIPRELDAFFFWLGYANSSLNPILYAIFNEEFRRAFAKLLGCYRRQRPGASLGSRTYMK